VQPTDDAIPLVQQFVLDGAGHTEVNVGRECFESGERHLDRPLDDDGFFARQKRGVTHIECLDGGELATLRSCHGSPLHLQESDLDGESYIAAFEHRFALQPRAFR
jgi:hypothetical protein